MEIRITNETLIDDLELSVRTANCLHNLYRDAKGIHFREPYAEQERPRIKTCDTYQTMRCCGLIILVGSRWLNGSISYGSLISRMGVLPLTNTTRSKN